MPNGSQGIFLSYRRDDAGVSASFLRMCLELDLPGTQVFKDTESIEPGANFRTRIEDAVRSSAVLLALIGPTWLTATDAAGRRRLFDPDDVLVREIALALRLDIRVIPVLVQGAAMPRKEDLPEVLWELAERQSEELDDRRLDGYRPRVKYIAATIERFLEIARAEQERGQRPHGGQVLDRKTPIPEFAEEIKGIRISNPANAMATLRIFAQERDVDELLRLWPVSEDADGFAPLDTVAILTLAAVDRTPAEAAELTVGLHRAEQGGSGLTESIIHDLTAQRTVPDLAEFIAECKRRGQDDLVEETLTAFVGSASRTSLDKALLYFELLRFHCASEAKTLLARTLSAEGARPRADAETPASAADSGGQQRPLAGVIGQVGIVGALRHLSPSGEIVEKWVDERIQTASVNWRETVELVANLLGNEPNGDRLLAKHVASKWNPAPLIRLCEILAGSAHRASPGLPLIRGYAATRDESSLADIIGLWCLSPVLSGSFPELVSEIVTDGARGPRLRPIPFFDNLALAVDQRRVPAKGRSELLIAAAAYVTGRPGREVAELLGRVGKADRRRAAQRINARFARDLAAGEVETGLFIDYLIGLKSLTDYLTLIFWAVRELTDPTAASPKFTGRQIGEIAAGIYDDDDDLKDTGFDLLERYLENEQAVTAADAMAIVKQVHASAGMRQDRRWDALLGATIGRWADDGHRDEVRDELRRPDQPDQGYLRAAAAILSLPQ